LVLGLVFGRIQERVLVLVQGGEQVYVLDRDLVLMLPLTAPPVQAIRLPFSPWVQVLLSRHALQPAMWLNFPLLLSIHSLSS
jgi:hypothetical protein